MPDAPEEIWRSTTGPTVTCHRADSGVVLRWPLASFHVSAESITVEASDPAAAFERVFHPIMSVALAARHLVTMHAFVANTSEGAVALMGPSGYGKSSLGLELLAGGAQLVSDDMLVIEDDGRLRPGPPFVRVLTADRAARDPGGKLRCSVVGAETVDALSLVIMLTDTTSTPQRVDRAIDGVQLLLSQMYTPVNYTPDQRRINLERAVQLAATVPIFECPRHHQSPADLAEWTMSLLRDA